MARRLKIDCNVPELFISSPANRALHTASIFLNVYELSYSNLQVDERLYGCGYKEILKVVKSQHPTINKLMIFGHNPDFSELASTFAKNTFADLPTCGIAIFEFNCSNWEDISKKNMENEYFDFPNKE
jgi:phosphohistidine phosphatase